MGDIYIAVARLQVEVEFRIGVGAETPSTRNHLCQIGISPLGGADDDGAYLPVFATLKLCQACVQKLWLFCVNIGFVLMISETFAL